MTEGVAADVARASTTPLTERERALVEGFRWLATIHHQVQHGESGKIPQNRVFETCEAKTCKYARAVIEGAERVDDDA